MNTDTTTIGREARCPECLTYCPESPFGGRFYCVAHGWFPEGDAAHITG